MTVWKNSLDDQAPSRAAEARRRFDMYDRKRDCIANARSVGETLHRLSQLSLEYRSGRMSRRGRAEDLALHQDEVETLLALHDGKRAMVHCRPMKAL